MAGREGAAPMEAKGVAPLLSTKLNCVLQAALMDGIVSRPRKLGTTPATWYAPTVGGKGVVSKRKEAKVRATNSTDTGDPALQLLLLLTPFLFVLLLLTPFVLVLLLLLHWVAQRCGPEEPAVEVEGAGDDMG
jgi:hypothetical protein